MKSGFLSFVLMLLITVTSILFGDGCANPIAPSGGPRDSLPPMLVNVTPKDSSINFSDNKIVFSFNEYVQIDNPRENILVSPVPKEEPVISARLRTITVKIKDTLEPSTTYSFNFGNSLKDINEGNIKKNFTYVFSTGKYIDSLELSGHVINARTGRADSTLTALLHRSGDDSALIKQKPRYAARLNGSGDFHFTHLAPGVYYLYALQDASGQRKYLDKTSLFAFAPAPITIGNKNLPDTLYAFQEEKDKKSGGTGVVKPIVPKVAKEKDKRLKFSLNLVSGRQDLLDSLVFTFTEPLKQFDSSRASLTDAAFRPVSNYRFKEDTGKTKLVLTYKWPENTAFNLIVDKDFAEDTSGRTLARKDTLRFTTMKESDYGNVNIRFSNIDLAQRPVLQFLQGEDVKYAVPLKGRDFHDKLFRPGEYELRILYDTNGNGVWDSGNFFGKRRQPERVIAIPKKLNVKANWDNDNSITL